MQIYGIYFEKKWSLIIIMKCINPVRKFSFGFSKSYCNIHIRPWRRSCELQIFQPKPSMYLYFLSRMHAIWPELDLPVNIWQKVQIMNLRVLLFSPLSFCFSFWPNIFFCTLKLSLTYEKVPFSSKTVEEIVVFKRLRKISESDY